MNPDRNPLCSRLLLIMIGLALIGGIVTGMDTAEEALPPEKPAITPEHGMVFLFFNKCLYICSLSYTLCTKSNPYKISFHNTTCDYDRERCNSTCLDYHAPHV